MPKQSAFGGSNPPGPVRIYSEFRQWPVFKGLELANQTRACAAPTGATGDRNLMMVPGYGNVAAAGFEWFVMGTQTILAPAQGNNGLDIGMDQTNNDGIQIDTGIGNANPLAFTVGSEGCYLKVGVTAADVSGCDPFLVGFRKLVARQADYNDYTDFAGIGIYDGGHIKTESALNNAATVTTDTTNDATDATNVVLEVYVDKAGAVTYKINGAAPAAVVAYTFDSGDVIMPFICFLHGTDVAGTVELTLFDCGLA